MRKKISIFNLYFKFFFFFRTNQKIITILSFVLGLFTSFLELVSVGLIVPFVTLITNPEKIYKLDLYKTIVGEKLFLLNELILISIFFFIGIILLSIFLKLIHLKLNCLVSYDLIRTFGQILFQIVLSQEYKIFKNLNTKDVVTTIALRSQNIGESNFFMITFASSAITVIFLLSNIIYFAPMKIIIFLLIIALLYYVFWFLIKKKITYFSKIYSENFQKLNKNIVEMMSSYTDIILYKLHNFFSDEFQKNNDLLRNSQGQMTFLSSYPLIVIQSVVLIVFIALIFYFYFYEILKDQLPFLILLVFSTQRIMPNVQTIFTSYSNLVYFKENLKKILIVLNFKTKTKNFFNNNSINKIQQENFVKINFQNIKFSYLNKKTNILFDDLNLEIKNGEKVILTGESGSGKSTFVKIILGFLRPTGGHLLINGKKLDEQNLDWWHSKVAYIPQKIFILDTNLYENISLKKNILKKEKEEIRQLLKMLNLSNLSSYTKDELRNFGGEEGKNFSGGQVQRIAIARALFQKRKFIILDEAFNALDKKNIHNIIKILSNIPSLTILLITHNDDLIKNFGKILKIKNKKIYQI
jgi:ATP-binding cassette subfamily B protein